MATIYTKAPSISTKFAGLNLNEAFDSHAIAKAELAISKTKSLMLAQLKKEYTDLLASFMMLDPIKMNSKQLEEISLLAFAIKSRAGFAGQELLGKIARSLYELCSIPNQNLMLHRIIKLHTDAMIKVFEGKFRTNDLHESQRLISGLNLLSKKFA